MNLRYLTVIIFILLCSCSKSWAQFQLQWADPQQIPIAQKDHFDQFLRNVENKIPAHMREGINFPIQVVFKDFDEGKELRVICRENDRPEEFKSDDIQQMNQVQRGSLLGGAGRSSLLRTRVDKVYLNKNFVSEIIKGKESKKYNCGQKNLAALAVSTLIHEIVHVYDYSSSHFSSERTKAEHCANKNSTDEECLKYTNKNGFLSGSPQYRALAGWRANPARGNQTKNEMRSRRDIGDYEYTGVNESLAVNMEYFLTDPEYGARRPAMYQFLSKQFNTQPMIDTKAKSSSSVFLTPSGERREIDLSKVYQIQYLYAAKGDGMMSRWGHAMFRIIMCDPSRKEVSEKCMEDVDQHLVVGFQANTENETIDPIKGIFGGYPSELFFFPVSDVMERYNNQELRDLVALPLNLSKEQKDLFTKHLLEQHWGYVGNYGFLTNNCATEAKDLIAAVLPSDHPFQKATPVSTPGQLYDALLKTHVGTNDPRKDLEKAYQEGNFLPSATEAIRDSLSLMEKSGEFSKNLKLDDYKSKYTAEQRMKIARQMIANEKNEDEQFKIASAFYTLEEQTQWGITKAIEKESMKLMETDLNSPEVKSISTSIKELLALNTQLLPMFSVKDNSGYGVPLKSELISENERKKILKRQAELSAKVLDWLKKRHSSKFAEFDKSLNNVQTLSSLLISREEPSTNSRATELSKSHQGTN